MANEIFRSPAINGAGADEADTYKKITEARIAANGGVRLECDDGFSASPLWANWWTAQPKITFGPEKSALITQFMYNMLFWRDRTMTTYEFCCDWSHFFPVPDTEAMDRVDFNNTLNFCQHPETRALRRRIGISKGPKPLWAQEEEAEGRPVKPMPSDFNLWPPVNGLDYAATGIPEVDRGSRQEDARIQKLARSIPFRKRKLVIPVRASAVIKTKDTHAAMQDQRASYHHLEAKVDDLARKLEDQRGRKKD